MPIESPCVLWFANVMVAVSLMTSPGRSRTFFGTPPMRVSRASCPAAFGFGVGVAVGVHDPQGVGVTVAVAVGTLGVGVAVGVGQGSPPQHGWPPQLGVRSEEHTSELQSRGQ